MVGQNGFQAIDARPTDIVAGTDTRQTVLTKLGTPSTTSTFESDTIWYYMSQTTEKYTYNRPQVTQRSVTEITFNDAGQVAAVRTLGLDDGERLACPIEMDDAAGAQFFDKVDGDANIAMTRLR